MINRTDGEIKFWYEHFLKFNKSNVTSILYCHRNNISQDEFKNWQTRFNPWRGKYFKVKEHEIELFNLYKSTESPRNVFCKKHNIPSHRLDFISTHYEYMKRLSVIYNGTVPGDLSDEEIENHNIEPQNTPMKFITRVDEINLPMPTPEVVQEAEVIEERNNIELTITKGVKVILSPEFETAKIIKIIELLKDL